MIIIFSDAKTAGTSTDDLVIGNAVGRNIVSHSVPMHDAQLTCNSEVTSDGVRVTDFIVEVRDDCKQRHHFMPCPRNSKGRIKVRNTS